MQNSIIYAPTRFYWILKIELGKLNRILTNHLIAPFQCNECPFIRLASQHVVLRTYGWLRAIKTHIYG